MKRFSDFVEPLAQEFGGVSYIGVSEGGAFGLDYQIMNKVLEASASHNPDDILAYTDEFPAVSQAYPLDRLALLCSRLSAGNYKPEDFRNFDLRSKSSLSYNESVLWFQNNEKLLSPEDRLNVLVIRAPLDPVAPKDTTLLEGTFRNYSLPGEHFVGIAIGLTALAPVYMNFLLRENNYAL
ncbi:MAG: hypothetical protein US60_C0006G0002 [Microgenomates group bacterium GW2011_GWC1_37_8]|uniref:Uncharacterized protein n=1 Tax=Candidatus Woesebacteria bacterium GW2011_GWB1_38_8 TaxID=1618570 RepID=A0A0G0LB24_9BACT|nr:MAG: hypothetical protein US60_C0006G0002 [Microgenomates group bacterium GW2011_GWC1_37_8]KKQ85075.1 MAG: hypothetical protein UT08_C0010G0002 [Candidatus Woesebacteria bacterium GW2011_GWB1_38_8]